jgi:hypothetical protein
MVQIGSEAEELKREIARKLAALRDEDGASGGRSDRGRNAIRANPRPASGFLARARTTTGRVIFRTTGASLSHLAPKKDGAAGGI